MIPTSQAAIWQSTCQSIWSDLLYQGTCHEWVTAHCYRTASLHFGLFRHHDLGYPTIPRMGIALIYDILYWNGVDYNRKSSILRCARCAIIHPSTQQISANSIYISQRMTTAEFIFISNSTQKGMLQYIGHSTSCSIHLLLHRWYQVICCIVQKL